MNDSHPSKDVPLEIDVVAVKELLDRKANLLVVDCREQDEHTYCQIEGSLLIPMNETPDRISEIESFRELPIVVYCHLGIRSFQVVSWLRMQGFANSQSMAGGIEAWSLRVDETMPRY